MTTMKALLLTFFLSFSANAKTLTATFAGGCFWCVESAFDDKPGVLSAISGYSNGAQSDAQYEKVSSGKTQHFEAVQVKYDDTKTDYKKLLNIFFKSINPTDTGGQFADRGPQYKTAIFFHDSTQEKLAKEAIEKLNKAKIFRRTVEVPVLSFKTFFPAEEYHQDYHKKKSKQYKAYFYGSGRGPFLDDLWGKDGRHKDYVIFK